MPKNERKDFQTDEAEGMERENEMSELSPDQIIKILLKHGEKVSLDEAKHIQENIKIFVTIALNQYLRIV